ncbi:NADP-dependent oxidoreductase [Paracrocinitomix mangrovi]|uniref:NADP-dependent oxidoreductase n=1 Tax=Paracrocinitomix mangrovi TaxID=2862509 RepID=UPI001C8DAB83|nr:NADP-dependent oxidoreductase [Paracrocinitomix mangrovi]UKN00225.1 NADP-dependent oxidoreductase [Paracrocinitomix mangrovi]
METTILIGKDYGYADQVLDFYTQTLNPLSAGYARIKVKAAGINPIDARRMTGEFKHSSTPQAFGTEFAGEIVEINGSTTFQKGDAVLGSGGQFTHASIIDVPVVNLVAKPQNISWEVAGSLAGVAQTAMTIIDELGPIKSLLIHGASGGVGSISIQLAVERGIEVVATASAKNQEYLKNLGATPVEYGPGLIERIKAIHPAEFDASVDMVGTEEATQASLATVKADGQMRAISGRPLSSNKIQALWVKRNVNNLQYVVDGISSDKFQWTIDSVFPFSEAKSAYSQILEGHNRGKVVLAF